MPTYRVPQPWPTRTRTTFGPRDLRRFPVEPTELGPKLFAIVEEAAQRGLPRPVILGFSAETVEQHELLPIARAGGDVHRFVAAVAGQEGVQAVALAGAVMVRFARDPAQTRAAVMVFVEWPDGRWWSALRILQDRRLVDEHPAIVRSAWAGHPRPGGLGGWWSRARVEGLRLQLAPVNDPAEQLDN